MQKKTRNLIIIIVIIVLVAGAAGTWMLYRLKAPDMVLLQAISAVKKNGVRGLEPYTTQETWENIDSVVFALETGASVLALLDKSNITSEQLGTFVEKCRDITWKIQDVKTGSRESNVVISFDYQGRFTGTIDLIMKKEKGEWKISGLSFPRFTKFLL